MEEEKFAKNSSSGEKIQDDKTVRLEEEINDESFSQEEMLPEIDTCWICHGKGHWAREVFSIM